MNAKALPNTQNGNAPLVHYNYDRLADLRDRHIQTLENYRRASAAVKEAAKSLAQLRTAAASTPGTRAPVVGIVRKVSAVFQPTPAATETKATPRNVQQIKSAETRLGRLTTARDALKDGVAQSAAFNTRLENFARERNL
ncbi:MAG: hypothetical protein ACOH2K_09610 [Burkholderiaceae bacterium]